MSRRRAVLALSVLFLLTLTLIGNVSPVRAQSEVDDAADDARNAADDADRAFAVVESAVANRTAVETHLFEVLDRYTVNSDLLSQISAELTNLTDSLNILEAKSVEQRETFEEQAVAAYIQALTSAPVVFDTSTVESAMVAQETLGRVSQSTLDTLDEYLAFSSALDDFRTQASVQQDAQLAIKNQLELDTEELEALFAEANTQVSEAFVTASAAESRLSDALDAVRVAEAAEAERRRAEEAARSTTTTLPPTTSPPGDGATTTTTPPSTTAPESWPPIPINSTVLSWRPLIERHFSSDLVLDALVIMQCESLGDPNAINPYSGASGLFQFMPATWAVASVSAGVGDRSVFDGEANIIAASWLAEYYRSRGLDPWRPWSCRVFL